MSEYEYSAEKRRNSRRDFEKNIFSNDSDRIQINDLMLGAMVIIAGVVSFTDFSFSLVNVANITALTIFLFIVTTFVYRNRYSKGIRRGRKDEAFGECLSEYRAKIKDVYDRKMAGLVPSFCTWYKKKELMEYRESLLCDIEMPYEVYRDKYLNMPKKEVMKQHLSLEAKRIILKCNAAKSIKLSPGMILNENGEYLRHKLIGKSGRQREKADKKREAITRAVYVIFGTIVAFDVILNFSVETVLQWAIRMVPIIIAIITGDDGGYCNITVTETAFKKAQVHLINLFNEYLVETNKATKEEPTETPTND